MTTQPKTNHNSTKSAVKSANILHSRRISPFWLLPFIAFCIGIALFYKINKEQGEEITIYFNNASGLVADKTPIRYQGLQIGIVKRVNFTDDLKLVKVTANINPEASSVLREDTKFWVVQPSASLAGVSGLDALVSGNYITLIPGEGKETDEFVAEEKGPIAEVSDGDLQIHLIADDLGSISLGSSVYFRKVPVGKVYNYTFTDNKKLEISLVIDKEYADLVKSDSRFWNISGIKTDISLKGVSVTLDSFNSIIQGAIAFDSPEQSQPASNNDQFTLYPSIKAAKRGISVDVILPSSALDLKENDTAVYYRDLQVGVLSEINKKEEENQIQTPDKVTGKLLLDPSIKPLLHSNTEIILKDPPSLNNLFDLKQIFKGKSLEIISNNSVGEPVDHFVVLKQSERLLKQPNSLVFNLTTPQTYGIEEGQPINYNGIKIGEVVDRKIDIKQVTYKVAIAGEYRHLIHADTQFVAASNLDINVSLDGVRFEAAPPQKWLEGGINVVSGEQDQGEPLSTYPLYKSLSDAQSGITGDKLEATLQLTAQELPQINEGSAVLYRQYQVGKIISITPNKKHFNIELFIDKQYRHLLNEHSRFWVESAAKFDISAQGIKVESAPLTRVLKGAVSFDNVSTTKGNKQLYSSKEQALTQYQTISFSLNNASGIKKDMPIRYLGIDVGKMGEITLNTNQQITAKAYILAQYSDLINREGSQFSLITPEINAGGLDNLDALLQSYIDVQAGKGKASTHFKLNNSQTARNHNVFPIILETDNASALSVNSPVLYRGIEVGVIHTMKLDKLGDRVLVTIHIDNEYRHLIRQNTQFWEDAGYSFSLGWRGVNIHTGTTKQLLRGGIAFATPSGEVVQPQAKANQRFLLQNKKPENSDSWIQAKPSN